MPRYVLRMTETIYPGFAAEELTLQGETRQVWVGGSGPAVILMHEIPGLYPEIVAFARVLVDAGYTVFMPSLVGEPGRGFSVRYNVGSLLRVCIAREFTVWATGEQSAVVSWLRALARHAHARCGGPGVGAIGMCLTGGFALAMMVEDAVIAPVLSQPSLPLAVGAERKRDLGIDEQALGRVKERAAAGACVLGLRFTGDRLAPAERFDRLREELGGAFLAIEIDSSIGNPHRIPPWAHSVLVHDFVDAPGHPTRDARARVLDFLRERLQPAGA